MESDRERADRLEAINKVMEPIVAAAVMCVLDQESSAQFAPSGVWVKTGHWNALRDAVMKHHPRVVDVHKAMGRQDAIVRVKGIEASGIFGL